ncbi:MAG: hypothetical protein Dbin4_02821 [Alphaproteobacteria bacterium]|nr:hypothetical protein [Alphaproteobacteria bacterium]
MHCPSLFCFFGWAVIVVIATMGPLSAQEAAQQSADKQKEEKLAYFRERLAPLRITSVASPDKPLRLVECEWRGHRHGASAGRDRRDDFGHRAG